MGYLNHRKKFFILMRSDGWVVTEAPTHQTIRPPLRFECRYDAHKWVEAKALEHKKEQHYTILESIEVVDCEATITVDVKTCTMEVSYE